MKKLLLTTALILASVAGYASAIVPLFNGKDLAGWKVHGTEKWFVEDGDLVCESGPDRKYGYLATEKPYKNFILTLEYQPLENGNSGVFVRSKLKGTDITGWQVEIAPRLTGYVYESGKGGRKWLNRPDAAGTKASVDRLKQKGWNTMKIEVNGDTIKSWINGDPVTDLTDEIFGKGEGIIALQIHAVRPDAPIVKVRWRNIEIQELP